MKDNNHMIYTLITPEGKEKIIGVFSCDKEAKKVL